MRLNASEAERIAEVMGGLATPARVLILARLLDSPATVSELVTELAMSQASVSNHLRILRHVTPVAAVTPIFFIPVFGVAWSYLFLAEPVSSGTFVGGALVLLAAALVTGFNPLRRKLTDDTPPA